MELVARLAEDVERGYRNRFVNRDDVRERQCALRTDGHGWWAAARSGTRAAMAPVAVRCRMTVPVVVTRHRRVVAHRGGRQASLRIDDSRTAGCTVGRAAHDPLGLAHEERHPERECDCQNLTVARTAHAVRAVIGPTDKWLTERLQYTPNACGQAGFA